MNGYLCSGVWVMVIEVSGTSSETTYFRKWTRFGRERWVWGQRGLGHVEFVLGGFKKCSTSLVQNCTQGFTMWNDSNELLEALLHSQLDTMIRQYLYWYESEWYNSIHEWVKHYVHTSSRTSRECPWYVSPDQHHSMWYGCCLQY